LGEEIAHILVGLATPSVDEYLAPLDGVNAFIGISVSAEQRFEARIQLDIGRASRARKVVLPPDTRTPFMINIAARADDEELHDTAAVFQGVFTASPRLGLAALSIPVGPVGP